MTIRIKNGVRRTPRVPFSLGGFAALRKGYMTTDDAERQNNLIMLAEHLERTDKDREHMHILWRWKDDTPQVQRACDFDTGDAVLMEALTKDGVIQPFLPLKELICTGCKEFRVFLNDMVDSGMAERGNTP